MSVMKHVRAWGRYASMPRWRDDDDEEMVVAPVLDFDDEGAFVKTEEEEDVAGADVGATRLNASDGSNTVWYCGTGDEERCGGTRSSFSGAVDDVEDEEGGDEGDGWPFPLPRSLTSSSTTLTL